LFPHLSPCLPLFVLPNQILNDILLFFKPKSAFLDKKVSKNLPSVNIICSSTGG
jgi:hypothetical protein